jgi:hypothetical protein
VKVFILTSGPHYEGATLTRVFDDLVKAVKAVDTIETIEPLVAREELGHYWENKFEWVSISEKEVE